MTETIRTLKGLSVKARLVQEYPKGRLYYAQERLVITDNNNKEIESLDVVELVTKIKDPFNSHSENFIS